MAQGIMEPTPFKITCSNCKVDLKIDMPGLILILPVTVLMFLAVLAAAAWLVFLQQYVLAVVLGFGSLAMLFCLEFVYGLLIFTYASFTPKEQIFDLEEEDVVEWE